MLTRLPIPSYTYTSCQFGPTPLSSSLIPTSREAQLAHKCSLAELALWLALTSFMARKGVATTERTVYYQLLVSTNVRDWEAIHIHDSLCLPRLPPSSSC